MAKAGVKVEAGQTWECVTSSDARLIALTLRPFKGRSTAWVCLVLELENASLDGGPRARGRRGVVRRGREQRLLQLAEDRVRVQRGQTWEHSEPGRVLIVLTLKPPKRGCYEWTCLVLLDDYHAHGQLTDFAVNNSDWWRRIA